MSLKALVKIILNDPDTDDAAKEDVQSLMASHLVTGMELKHQGLLHEAIGEFAKENTRPIRSSIDKEIVQKSYVLIGSAYRELNDIENAKAAFTKALELWRQYGYGSAPHYDLAEILALQGFLDEAIDICQESLKDIPDGGTKQLLNKLLFMKNGEQ